MNLTKCLVFLFSLVLYQTGVSAAEPRGAYAVQQFTELANAYEQSLFDHFPELSLYWGRPKPVLDRFTNPSLSALKKWHTQENHFLTDLQELDTEAMQQSSQYPTYLLLKETLLNNQASRICHEELWDVNPVTGWHNTLAFVATQQPVGTAQLRALALQRWKSFDRYVDEQIDNLNYGLTEGFSAPKSAVRQVIAQLQLLIDGPAIQSPFFDFARRDDNEVFKQEVEVLVAHTINPALKKYQQFLQKQYLPKARQAIGVYFLPQGVECYQAKLRQENSLDKSPTEIHQIGKNALAKLAVEIKAIGIKLYQTDSIPAIFSEANQQSQGYFATDVDLMLYNLDALARVQKELPKWFSDVPETPGIIKPYPLHRAKTGASGEYQPPSKNGLEPGIFFINTFEAEKRSRVDLEATLFHELIPGHHFQFALLNENKALPSVNSYLNSTAFVEGWALYVERLADEMGVYRDEVSRLGMLSNESLRAARLVVDTGIHAFYWTRQQAIDYLQKHTALSQSIIEGEVDRYTMLPGQATAYLLGKNEIQKLRKQAENFLEDDFDIRQFHYQVLKNGLVSLPILQQSITDWLATTKH